MTAAGITSDGENASGSARDMETSSFLHVEIMSNNDLYCMTPPAYAQSVADNEVSLDVEEVENEKIGVPGVSYTRDAAMSPQAFVHTPQDAPRAPSPASIPAPVTAAASLPTELPPVYFSELTADAVLAHVRRCTVLPSRPAVWLVKRKNFALSPLAATVLVKEGLIRNKDLQLISQSSGAKRDPTDPLSAIAFATYDTVGDMMLGLVAGPVEAAKQITPMLVKYEAKQKGHLPPNVRVSVLQESAPLVPQDSAPRNGSSTPGDTPNEAIKLEPESWAGWEQPNCWSDAERSRRRNSTLEAAPNAAKQVAIGTGKGLGRIVGAGLRAPMTFTHGLTRGFHNIPKLYGDEVREYENVTDLRSGLSVSAKGFGHGLSDGLKDFFVNPIQGAQKEGGKGFAKGVGKGIGNLVCKPSAGICGLVGYSFVGVYKELQNIGISGKDSAGDILRYQGEAEYEQATDQERVDIVKRWCQVMMWQY